MTYQFAFEKLDVWQDARKLVKEIYAVTKEFPTEERFGLITQIRRAATSICANLAEGSTRQTAKDQAHFSSMAFGSLIELLNHLILSADLEYITMGKLDELKQSINPLSLRINNLRTAQLSRVSS